MSQMINKFLPPFLFWFASFGLAHGQIRVEATFDPQNITSANTTIYKIVVHGTQQSPLGAVPSVDGLTFSSPPRTLRSASFINGVPSIRFELSFTVTPQRQGSFVVPSWNLEIENDLYAVPPARLQVLPPNQKDKLKQAQQRKQQADLREAAFLEFSCPRPFLFEGETVAAKVSLFLWNRLPVTRIEQIPTKSGSGFSMTELGQPVEQRDVKRFNKTYSVYSWNFGLTGALPGKHSISFDSSIRVRVRNNRNSPFSSPFFNDPFFGFGREEGLKISSDSLNLEIRPLPVINRPANFQGAIGNLSIVSDPDSNRVSVGDPVRLTCVISGTGNFAAMPAPDLSFGKSFKVGPPAFSFDGNENTKQNGSQTFEFIVTPLQAGLLEIPPVSFSYFDPLEEKYYSLSTDSHNLRVDPGEKWIAPKIAPSSTASVSPKNASQDLFQTESEPGNWINKLATPNPLESNTFWIIQITFSGIFISILIFRFKGRNPRLEARKQKERLLETKAREALKHKDVPGLHQALRRRIRLRVGIACDQSNTSALSSTEIINLLNTSGYSDEIVGEVLQLLKICDESEYAGTSNEPSNIESTFQRSRAILKKIK